MKLPRNLAGEDLVALLSKRWGYVKVHQVGSHAILQTQEPSPHRIAVPLHKSLRVGHIEFNRFQRSRAQERAERNNSERVTATDLVGLLLRPLVEG